jgi:hypothetical protein
MVTPMVFPVVLPVSVMWSVSCSLIRAFAGSGRVRVCLPARP